MSTELCGCCLPIVKKQNIYNYDNYVKILIRELHDAWSIAQRELLTTKIKNKAQHDKKTKNPTLKPEDFVLVNNESKKHKFDKPLLGPFKVLEIMSDQNIIIEQNGKRKKIHRNRTKKSNSTSSATTDPPAQTDDREEPQTAKIKSISSSYVSFPTSSSQTIQPNSSNSIMEINTEIKVNALQEEFDRCEDAMMEFLDTFY